MPSVQPSVVCLFELLCIRKLNSRYGGNILANRQPGRSVKKKATEEEVESNRLMLHRDAAASSLASLSEIMALVRSEDDSAKDLQDHARGFYEEIDKLAKGKAMLEVTDRALEEANSIISDSKRIVGNDPYLNRTHEFVAAGNNPVYPDVLLALRSVLQSLDRFRAKKAEESAVNAGTLNELNTILAAIELLAEGMESITKDQLLRRMGHAPSQKWIFTFGFNDPHFDLEKLINQGPPLVKIKKGEKLALGSGE